MPAQLRDQTSKVRPREPPSLILASPRSRDQSSTACSVARRPRPGSKREDWLAQHDDAVMTVLFLVFGAKLIADGRSGVGASKRRIASVRCAD